MGNEMNTPWWFGRRVHNKHVVFGQNSLPVDFDDDATLERIVRRVNSHDALVSALRDFLSDFAGVYADGEPAVIHAKAALAAATKELS